MKISKNELKKLIEKEIRLLVMNQLQEDGDWYEPHI
jgi:hypothetical protein